MGEIADKMINGELCSQCGVHLDPGSTVYLTTGETVYMPSNGEAFGVPVLCEFCNDGEQGHMKGLVEKIPEGKEAFGLIAKLDNQWYLELSNACLMRGYPTLETAIKDWTGEEKKEVLSVITPHIIKLPADPKDLYEFYLDGTSSYSVELKRESFRFTMDGALCHDNILDLSVYDLNVELNKIQ